MYTQNKEVKIMERKYIEPEMEVTKFSIADVITTSDGIGGGGGIILPDDEW